MTVSQRFFMLLTSPDEATYDVYDTPSLGHAFIIVSLHAILSALNSFLSTIIKSEDFGFSFIAFLGTFLTTYLTWVFLTILFHVLADLWGGLGELMNAVAYVGFAAAPLALASVFSLLLTAIGPLILPDDPDQLLAKIGLGISLVGMAWGWPGLLCYFGLKNGERLHEAKAATIALVAFVGFTLFEVLNSSLFQ
jgi:hypothetical protein